MIRPTAALAVLALALALAPGAAQPPRPDKAFDELVPPSEVRAALIKLDPASLAAVAAKAAAAEKKLGRPRPAVSAIQLYEITIRVAGERRAAVILERLAVAEVVKADERLVAILSATRLAATATRNADPELVVAMDQITPEQFATFRGYLTQLQDAKALADRDALDRLAQHVAGVQDLTGPQKKYLAKAIAATAKAMPAKPPAAAVAVKQAREAAAKEEAEADPPEPKTPAGGDAANPGSLAGRLGGDTSALVDDGFEGKIDLAKIGKAWGRGDAVALADYAFRMADEERILGRPHRHVPAKALFQASFGLAIANSDAATVARLEKGLKGDRAPDFEGKAEFLAKLDASKTLVASSRKGRQPFLAPIDKTAPESFRAFRTYLDRIRAAAAQKDAGLLAGLTEGMDAAVELDDAQRAYLRREAGGTENAGAPDAAVGVLRALEGEARGGPVPALNAGILRFCRARVGAKADDGTAEMLAVRAFEAAGARPPAGADAVWGKVVTPADARPGDVVRFRDVVVSFTHPDGRTRSQTYARHTAVISDVDGPNRFTVLHQDVGPPGKDETKRRLVQVGWLDLAAVKEGTVVVYRPQPR